MDHIPYKVSEIKVSERLEKETLLKLFFLLEKTPHY